MTDAAKLDVLVGSVKLVLCLVPYIFNTRIVESAIRCKTNVVTTSYISAEMQALAPAIERAGSTVLCEMGLDPGIDHLYAVKIVNEVHGAGGKISSFHLELRWTPGTGGREQSLLAQAVVVSKRHAAGGTKRRMFHQGREGCERPRRFSSDGLCRSRVFRTRAFTGVLRKP